MITILIVDDDPRTCQYIGDFFKERGLNPVIVTDPLKASATVKQKKPQIVLLDVLMPQMSGLEVLKSLKKEHGSSLKVIMVTVADDEDTMAKAKEYGADDFIRKPFDTNYLEEVVMAKIAEALNYREGSKK